jgi:ABC-type ATPase with predicted acetyltransferase domain
MPTRHRRIRPISRRARRACAMFGLRPEVVGRILVRGCEAAAAEIDRALPPGGVALITGPSGSGKSTILRLLAERLAAADSPVIRPPDNLPEVAVVDQFRRPLESTLRLLARAGLADAMAFALLPSQLSDGQRWRLRLALAMAEAEAKSRASRTPATLIVDEFASTLDRLSARCIARVLGRWVGSSRRLRAICATAHDDLAAPLLPALLVHQPLSAPPEIRRGLKEPL